MRALRAPNRAQRILWRISRDLNEAAPNGPFSDEWPNPNPNPYRNPNPNPSPNPIDAIYSLVCLVSSPRPAPNSGRCLYTIAAQIAIIYINYILQCDIGNNIIQHGNVRIYAYANTNSNQTSEILNTNTYIIIVIIILN